ncbi:MAG: PrsW family intramembrane metalloprotease [Bacteroidetes bacterium]|nr:MAG: PrsW family intramembrane metalloprotease [Bacteroidota bacterium]
MEDTLFLLAYSLVALFISWIWVDYYRLIDVYDKVKLKYLIIAFLLGCTSVFVTDFLAEWMQLLFPRMTGNLLNDLGYCIFRIGLTEEVSKITPLILMLILFKDQFREPLDYLAFACTCALGFSAVENVLYFQIYGPEVIKGRAVLSTIGHMFDTALVAYGIILWKYRKNRPGVWNVPLFLFLGALSHGIYDFILMYRHMPFGVTFYIIMYFLMTISLFAVMLNNALNNSAHFSYKKVVDSHLVSRRILTYYGVLFLVYLGLTSIKYGLLNVLLSIPLSILTTGAVLIITALRLSRFRLEPGVWEKLRFELPFHVDFVEGIKPSIIVKGNSYNEVYVNTYYEEYFQLVPLSSHKSYLKGRRKAYIWKKEFAKSGRLLYSVRVYDDLFGESHGEFVLRPKTAGATMYQDKYPICALMKAKSDQATKLLFYEWVVLLPLRREEERRG